MNTADLEWRKSSRSDATLTCVEVAFAGPVVGVRDSKNIAGPPLALPVASFIGLLVTLK